MLHIMTYITVKLDESRMSLCPTPVTLQSIETSISHMTIFGETKKISTFAYVGTPLNAT